MVKAMDLSLRKIHEHVSIQNAVYVWKTLMNALPQPEDGGHTWNPWIPG